eukprot:750942-Hanusia_phi.AAC.10
MRQRHEQARRDQTLKDFMASMPQGGSIQLDLETLEADRPLQEVLDELNHRDRQQQQHAIVVSSNKVFDEEMKRYGSKILADNKDERWGYRLVRALAHVLAGTWRRNQRQTLSRRRTSTTRLKMWML